MMTKQQMQSWVGLNCKFAAMNRFADELISRIVEAKIAVSGEVFVKIVEAVLKEEIARLAPDIKERLLKMLMSISRSAGPLTEIDMRNRLVGLQGQPGILDFLKLPRATLQDPEVKAILDEVMMNQRMTTPKTAPHSKETRNIDWEAAKGQQNLNLTPRVPPRKI